jgi:tetratricopeptide (TPR) repeat protein
MDMDDLESYSSEQIWAQLNEAINEEKVDLLLELHDRSDASQDYIQAASLADQAATEAKKCMSNEVVENIYYKQGIALWRADRNLDAVEAFSKGIAIYQEPDSKVELSKNQWGVAAAYLDNRDYEQAITWARASSASAISMEAFRIAATSKFIEAKSLNLNGDSEAALAVCEEARAFRRLEKELVRVAEIDAYMAEIYSELGNYSESVNLLRNCLVLAEATSAHTVRYYSYRLGNSLIDLGEFLEARSYLERSHALYSEEEDHESVADCCYSLSLTYRGDENLVSAISLARSATSLWDALGSDRAYIKGLQRIAILLFSQGDFWTSIETNQRIIDFCRNSDEDYLINSFGWAILRMVDCFQALGNWEKSLEHLDATKLFGKDSTHSGNAWFYSLKAAALYQLNLREEALGVADTGLSLTNNEEVDLYTATLYEIKARVSLEQNRPDKERHLAHAIALLLAFNYSTKARELSEYFKPDFSPPKSDNILSDENADSSIQSRIEEISFGFAPN